MKKIKWIILITVAVLLLVSPCVNSEFVSDYKETLRGIKSIKVGILGSIKPEAEKFGLTKDKIQTDVELRLRMAGISVISSGEPFTTSEPAYLFVSISMSCNQFEYFAYGVMVSVAEKVNLERNPNLSCLGNTWWLQGIGGSSGKEIERVVRNSVKDLVDEFLNDYLAVNPKQVNKPQGGN